MPTDENPHLLLCVFDDSPDCTCNLYPDDVERRRHSYFAFMEALERARAEDVVVTVCGTHDILPRTERFEQAEEDGEVECFIDLPLTEQAQRDWADGYDPCMPVIGFTREVLEEFHQ